jgi:hypothetical protein
MRYMANYGKKPPGSGRKAGVPNLPTQKLSEKAAALGIDPFEVLLLFAKGDWAALGYETGERLKSAGEHGDVYEFTISPDLRARAARDACDYLYPRRKAVALTDADGGNPFKTFTEMVLEAAKEK